MTRSNDFGGTAHNAVQIGGNAGDIHFHGRPALPKPNGLPAPTPHFTNQRPYLDLVGPVLRNLPVNGTAVLVVRGEPGTGKGEFAYRVGQEHADRFPDGIFYADFAGQPGQIREKLGEFLLKLVEPDRIPDSLDGRTTLFRDLTTGQAVLVVVDNAVSAAQVWGLRPAGRSALIATQGGSLAGLAARTKVTFVDLAPLSDEHARELLAKVLDADPATVESAEFGSLVEVCGGLPMALSQVGAMISATPGRPLSRFVRKLATERGRLSALYANHDLTLRATFDTGYQQLSPEAAACYRAIGVHQPATDLGLPALAAALGLPEDDVPVDELLAVQLTRASGPDRFAVHQLIGLHAKQVADEDPGSAVLLGRFLDYYRRTAFVAGQLAQPNRGFLTDFWPGPVDEARLSGMDSWAWLTAERRNLLTIARRAFEVEEWDTVCVLAVALWPLHERGKYAEDLAELSDLGVRAALRLGRPDVAGLLLSQHGFAHQFRAEWDEGYEKFKAGAETATRTDIRATAIEGMGLARFQQGQQEEAGELLEQNLSLATEIGAPRRLALAQMHLAKAADLDKALELLNAAEQILGTEPVNKAKILTWRGRRQIEAGQMTEAVAPLTEAHHIMSNLNRGYDRALAAEWLGRATGNNQYLQNALADYKLYGTPEDTTRLAEFEAN